MMKRLMAALMFVTLGLRVARAEPASAAPEAVAPAAAPAAPAESKPNKDAAGSYKRQAEAASTTVTFASVAKTNAAYTAALEAHDLEGAKSKVGQAGAFKGTVSGLFERTGFLVVNFDKDYRKALSAVVRSKSFSAFPNLQTLVGKEIVVSGTFTLHQERPQIQLETATQITVAE